MASLASLCGNVPMAALCHSLKQLQLVNVMNKWQMDRYRQVLQFKSFRMFWLGFTFNLGFGLILVWLPIYADRVLNGGPELYGLLLGFVAIGEVLSSILAGGLIFALTLGTLICLVQFLAGVTLGLLLLSQNMGWVIFSLILFGLFHAPLTIWAQTLRMQIIPEALRGRTFALLRTLMQGTIPVGGILAGFLSPILGIPAMIGLSAVLIGIPGLFGYQVKDLRRGGESLTRDLV